MRTRQPDRFEKMAEDEFKRWLKGPQEFGWLEVAERCMARQHREYVRMVKHVLALHLKVSDIAPSPECQGGIDACGDILKAFARYKAGKG